MKFYVSLATAINNARGSLANKNSEDRDSESMGLKCKHLVHYSVLITGGNFL